MSQSTHDPLCVNSTGSCCDWIPDCTCQCLCDFIKNIRDDERRRKGKSFTFTVAEDMPMWKEKLIYGLIRSLGYRKAHFMILEQEKEYDTQDSTHNSERP